MGQCLQEKWRFLTQQSLQEVISYKEVIDKNLEDSQSSQAEAAKDKAKSKTKSLVHPRKFYLQRLVRLKWTLPTLLKVYTLRRLLKVQLLNQQ